MCPFLARMFHELLSRDQEDGRATGKPQDVDPEAYLNGTSQGPTSEDVRKDGHIIRAPLRLVPQAGSQFRGRSRWFMQYPG